MALIHQRYDPALGAAGVDLLERLQVFNVFTSWWFSAGLIVLLISIVVCTLDRTPRLWRQVDRHPRRAAGAVLRPAAARPGGGRRAGRRRRCARRPAPAPVPRSRGDGRRRPLPLRRPPPVHEDGDAAHAPGAHPVPRRGRGHEPPRVRGAARGRGGRDVDGPADRHAGPARRQEPRVPGPTRSRRLLRRLHDRPCGLPGRRRDRPQDDPRQRPAARSPGSRSTRTASGRRPCIDIRDAQRRRCCTTARSR